MKFLAVILSIYILALNLVDCEDNGMFDIEVKTELSQSIGDDHQHQGLDLCSPFCKCNCCQINIINSEFVEFSLNSMDISTEVFYHFEGLEKNFNNSILQPPRV